MGWQNVELEGDALEVINAGIKKLWQKLVSLWPINWRYPHCAKIFSTVKVSHARRKTNGAAHNVEDASMCVMYHIIHVNHLNIFYDTIKIITFLWANYSLNGSGLVINPTWKDQFYDPNVNLVGRIYNTEKQCLLTKGAWRFLKHRRRRRHRR